jgi:hypothetical protein
LTSSKDSPRSNSAEFAAVFGFLAAVIALAAAFFYCRGYLLYYGDAQAHLNISRSILDSRTPGYDQLGTVWLPLLHLLCLPFVQSTSLWHSGLAGTIPVACCFVIAGLCFYYAAREAYTNRLAACVVLLCFALNPNVLYLASIPMSEMVFLAGLSGYLLALLRFRSTQSYGYVCLAVAASWAMSLTRYDGWFLIPFAGLALAYCAKQNRILILLLFGTAASLAPLYWAAHNWWETGNALDFYNGPYSAVAIQGHKDYPGNHDWLTALRYYFEAGKLCSGLGLILLGAVGLACALYRRKFLACVFLLLTPLFYVWSMHSSGGSPIFLPTLWPHGYYNSRYGIAVEAACAFAAGAIVLMAGRRQTFVAAAVVLVALLPWTNFSGDNWICWKESQKNSDSRRAWTAQAATFLRANYRTGDGVLTEFGDLTGIFGAAEVPLSQALHEGNGPLFFANTNDSSLIRQCRWAIAQAGDKLARQLAESDSYEVVESIVVPGAPDLRIYRRKYQRWPA